jgi:hypothetical protein
MNITSSISNLGSKLYKKFNYNNIFLNIFKKDIPNY